MRCVLLNAVILLASLLAAQVSPPSPAPAQPPAPPATDKFGGLTALPSPGGATGYFRLEEATRGDGVKRWNFVSPMGNALYLRAVQNATYAFIEPALMQSRHGSDHTPWFTLTLKRIQAWGFNVIGDYAHLAFLPIGNPSAGPGGAAIKMPFILMPRPAAQATYHPEVCGSKQPIKDIVAGVPASYGIWDGTPMLDPFDPMWPACVKGEIQQWRNTFSGDFHKTPWIVGITTDDADFLWALKGAGDNPLKPNSYPHMGFLIAVANLAYKDHSDPKLYAKYAWSAYLQKKYGTVEALNAAWGSNYTSFGDDGGYGAGSGLLDEDGRHREWLGGDPYLLHGAKPAVQADLDAMLYQYVLQFESVEVQGIRAYDKHHLIFGPNALGGQGAFGTRPQVLPALAEAGVDALFLNYDSVYPQNLAVATAAYEKTGKPVLLWYGLSANQDSSWHGQSSTTDADYRTQEKRGQVYAEDQQYIFNAQAADGSFPILGIDFWGLTDDKAAEHTNWGLMSNRGNPYDGKCAVRATAVKDSWGAQCGGESAEYGDFLSAVTAANAAVVQRFLGEAVPAPKVPAVSPANGR